MARPGDEKTPGTGGGGHLRASHADREHAIEALKVAFVDGRLAKAEFDLRVGRAFTSRTYADLAAVTNGIPAAPAAARRASQPSQAPARSSLDAEIHTGVRAIMVTAVITVALWAIAIFADSMVALLAAWGASGTVLVIAFLTGTRVLGAWVDRRSGGHRPPPVRGAAGHGLVCLPGLHN